MILYWLALGAAIVGSLVRPAKSWSRTESWFIGILMWLVVGLREKVGSDWGTYLFFLNRAKEQNLQQTLLIGDPGYFVLNWYFASHPWGIYGVNLVVAGFFCYGVVAFCKAQTRPYLALSLAIPYLVIVVGMGYTRQSGAIGLVMVGLLWLEKGKTKIYAICLGLASGFHSTALVMAGFLFPTIHRGKVGSVWIRILIALSILYGATSTYFSSKLESLTAIYGVNLLHSEGAAIRVAMNLVPALIITFYPRKLGFTETSLRLWRWVGYSGIGCAVGLIVFPSLGTAIDRLALYLIPMQIVVGTRLPESRIFGLSKKELTSATIMYTVCVQFVWLVFATNARLWLPYKNILFT